MVSSLLGQRIHIVGNSCSGKSTLAKLLSEALGMDLVELDALNWLPNWVSLNDTNPEEFKRRLETATKGDTWVAAGSYSRSRPIFWSRVETVVWLDLPMPLLLYRVIRRSWKRARSKEPLWGSNWERFWPQFALWRGSKSLIYWILFHHRRKRRQMLGCSIDPQWSHIRFIRLRSRKEIERFRNSVLNTKHESPIKTGKIETLGRIDFDSTPN